MPAIFLTSVFLMSAAAVAASESLDPTGVYVLHGDGVSQGIFRYEPQSGSSRLFAPFIYFAPSWFLYGENLQLAALSDRIIAQGKSFYEFDLETGQLLRRYQALPPGYNWSFHGVAVTEEWAKRLGIRSGYYGFPICPPGFGATGIGCSGRPDFPGYPAAHPLGGTLFHILLRRPLDPASSSLEIAKVFPESTAYLLRRRFPAFDPKRNRLWFWINGTDMSAMAQRLSYVPIVGGTLGDEIVVRETQFERDRDRKTHRLAASLTYDSASDSFFHTFFYHQDSWIMRLTKQSIAGDFEQTLAGGPDVYHLNSVTSVPDGLPERYIQVLPAIAEVSGKNETVWRSDVWLFNPSPEPILVKLERVTKPGVTHEIALPAKGSAKIVGALSHLGGGGDGDGATVDALIIDSPYRAGAQLSVYSRTYTTTSDAGTYGQAVPAVPSTVGYSNHRAEFTTYQFDISEWEASLILDKRDPAQFRHNLGVVNTAEEPLAVRMRYATLSGHPPSDWQREAMVVVPPHSVEIYPVESLFPPRITDTLPPRIWLIADRPAPIWLSMVDNKTGDATFVPFSVQGIEAGPDARLAIPSIVHAPAPNGTNWQTDVYGLFPPNFSTDNYPQRPDANFYPAGFLCAPAAQQLSSSPGAAHESVDFWNTVFSDVGRQMCRGPEVRGALEVRTGSWMTAFSRTYTTRADGGTYGEMLPFYPPRGWKSRHFSGIELQKNFEINIGLYHGFDSAGKVQLLLYDKQGQLAATKMVELSPRSSLYMEIRQLFGSELPDGLYGLSVIPVDTEGCWPYVSIIDQRTGDPTNWW